MSAFETSYRLTREHVKPSLPAIPQNTKKDTSNKTNYLDIDSTYRDRNNYPDPSDFVIPITYPGRGSTSASAIDPVLDGIPYTGSATNVPGGNVTQVSPTTYGSPPVTNTGQFIALDPSEPKITNYYIDTILQIGIEYRTIIAYTYPSGGSPVATVSVPFSSIPTAGTVYYTRMDIPIYVGLINTAVTPATTTSFALDNTASNFSSTYNGSYVVFTSGANMENSYPIIAYNGNTKVITLGVSLPTIPVNGDHLEIDRFSRDNASTLKYSANASKGQSQAYYEIELLWISVPNQVLNVSYGGTLDSYPYVYVSLYNEGNQLASQVLYSNNPHTTTVLFKVPINMYFGDTAFITLKDCKMKQVIQLHPDQDLHFTVSLPDGTIVQFQEPESFSPNAPNPLLQINASFAIRKLN